MKKLVAIALIMLGIGIVCAFFLFDREDFNKELKGEPFLQEKTISSDSIRSLHAKTNTFNLEMIRGDSEDIKIRLEGNVSEKYLDKITLNAVTKGDVLEIESKIKNSGFTFGWTVINTKLIVELPERLWDSVEVDTDTGNVEIQDLNADKININTDVGNVKVSNYATKQFNVETDTGNITLTDGTGALKMKSDVGNIRVEAETIQNDITIGSEVGNVTISVDEGPKSANIRVMSEVGNVKMDWDGISSKSKKNINKKIGNGDITIDIETEVGNVKLNQR